jgi:hypothetical protein
LTSRAHSVTHWAVLFILITSTQAQQSAPLITNNDGWHTTSLDVRWQTIIDPYGTGFLTTIATARAKMAARQQEPGWTEYQKEVYEHPIAILPRVRSSSFSLLGLCSPKL